MSTNRPKEEPPPNKLPEPWPGMIAEVLGAFEGETFRSIVKHVHVQRGTVWFMEDEQGDDPTEWISENLYEVRSPSGAVLWRRE